MLLRSCSIFFVCDFLKTARKEDRNHVASESLLQPLIISISANNTHWTKSQQIFWGEDGC